MQSNWLNKISKQRIRYSTFCYVTEPKNAVYSKIKKDKEYDYLIISAVSTPIRLLSSYLNKMQP